MLLLAPTVLFAANSAMLTVSDSESSTGANNVLRSSALFVGDTVATRPDSVASINAEGSMVLVLADSSIQFEGNSVNMGHGGVVVTTSQAMAVRAGKLTIAPVAQRAAKFEVSDADGVIQIAAREGALAINDGSSTTILQQGQETTRQDSDQSEGPKKDKGAHPRAAAFICPKKQRPLFSVAPPRPEPQLPFSSPPETAPIRLARPFLSAAPGFRGSGRNP